MGGTISGQESEPPKYKKPPPGTLEDLDQIGVSGGNVNLESKAGSLVNGDVTVVGLDGGELGSIETEAQSEEETKYYIHYYILQNGNRFEFETSGATLLSFHKEDRTAVFRL